MSSELLPADRDAADCTEAVVLCCAAAAGCSCLTVCLLAGMLAGLGLAGLIGVPGEAVFASVLLGRSVLAAGMLLLEKAVLCLGDLRGDGWMLF